MIAAVVEIKGGSTKGRGQYEFLQLPAPGDHIVLGLSSPGLEIMRTLYVEHQPIALPKTKAGAAFGAQASVYVEHYAYWDVDQEV